MMASRPPPPPGKGKGVEFAYTSLRREIVSLTLRPGTPLDEAALAARLGLSRTPVHEALVRLASESLVVLLPNPGASVASLNVAAVREKHMNKTRREPTDRVAEITTPDAAKPSCLGRSNAELGRQRIQDVLPRGVSSALDIALDHPIPMLKQCWCACRMAPLRPRPLPQ